ncbi:Sorting nexin lst-4 [Cryptotermes secundus]|uniref:Sorting nexin n=1 Tax=Cryptotermes secundus TaxID=105785 RepID=A0A2J7PXU3_9NEOP|nr:sorting nexin lst-4 isoform X2 [Cryptotermes secundus]PNF21155.1 Sorting nexin lst-4 [Cryptotermes secundus]
MNISGCEISVNSQVSIVKMAGFRVQALYDFAGEPGTAELSITAGEVLTVTRQNVGEGWWEGVNQAGQTGLFPAAYVQEVKGSQPPAMPPPPLPEAFTDPVQEVNTEDTWGSQGDHQQQPLSSQQSYEGGDYWDDEWDDDSEGGGTQTSQTNNSAYASGQVIPKSGSVGDVSTIGKSDGKGTVGRKNFNRFTTFVKSGGESYILGTVKVAVREEDKVHIYESEKGVVWNPITEPYVCMVASPKKESKLKGLKSFIAYQLTPSFNNIQVSRRYKHFDWLHERLEEKFSLVPIPPLPDKQISGRYEEQFIEHRRAQLQAFVNSVCRHPVLSRCEVWQHFLTCTDEKRWKAGKRKAEKDELVGANFFITLQAPERPQNITDLEQETEKCSKFIHEMDGAIKILMATAVDQTKKHQGPYKREYQRIGHAFSALGLAFREDDSPESARQNLMEAVRVTGNTYHEIGKLFEEQPKLDWEPLADVLHLYKGIISSFPDILTVHKGSLQKRRECEKLAADHKMESSQLSDVVRRTDVISYALLAEINHFHSERAIDFRLAMQNYLKEQISFYQKIVAKLQDALGKYD